MRRMEISYFPTTREYTQQYGVTKTLLESLDKEITIMHPGPSIEVSKSQ